jgi:hypothetical protein
MNRKSLACEVLLFSGKREAKFLFAFLSVSVRGFGTLAGMK